MTPCGAWLRRARRVTLLDRLRGPLPPTRLRRAGPSLSRYAGEGAERSEAGEGATDLPSRVDPTFGRQQRMTPFGAQLRRAGPSLSRYAGEGGERSEAGEGATDLPTRIAPPLAGGSP
jgi:hypothetical protein